MLQTHVLLGTNIWDRVQGQHLIGNVSQQHVIVIVQIRQHQLIELVDILMAGSHVLPSLTATTHFMKPY